MQKYLVPILTFFLATPSAFSQSAENGKDLFNNRSTVYLWSFPNFFTSAGNASGDCEWKILPPAAMKSGAGTETITGFVLPVVNNNFHGGPLDVPDIELRGITNTGGCIRPDFSAPPTARISAGSIVLPAPGTYLLNLSLDAGSSIPMANGTHAVCLMAPVGENYLSPDATRPFITIDGSDPDVAACHFGKSGKYSALTQRVLAYAPSYELYLETSFAEPTVQPVADRAISPDKGYGAYDFSVADGTRTLGWHVEARQHIGRMAFPLASFSGSTNLFYLNGIAAYLNPDQFLYMLVVMQQAKVVQSQGTPGTPQEDGVMDTFDFPIPMDVAGATIDVVVYFFDSSSLSLVEASNTCTTRFVR